MPKLNETACPYHKEEYETHKITDSTWQNTQSQVNHLSRVMRKPVFSYVALFEVYGPMACHAGLFEQVIGQNIKYCVL